MRLFIDTEFNSYKGNLLSMALVAEDPLHEWYHEFPLGTDVSWVGWVKDNVVPLMDTFKEHQPKEMRERIIASGQKNLESWLKRFGTIHIVADWPEDIHHFCQFLITGPGTRIDTPPLTMEVLRDLDTVESEVPHHALHDARAIRDSFKIKVDQDKSQPWEEGKLAYQQGLGISDNPYITGPYVGSKAILWHQAYEHAHKESVK